MADYSLGQQQSLTQAEMETILYAHEDAERTGDVDIIMSTVSDDPHYELVSIGWKVDGWDAVREMYRRMNVAGPNMGRDQAMSTKRVHATAPGTLIREAALYFTQDGKRTAGQYTTVLTFAQGKISGERMYLDPIFAQGLAHLIGEDFGDVPGVTRL